MLFSSWVFIAGFLPVTWLVFYYLRQKAGAEISFLWLVATSLFFYGWLKAEYVLIILVSMCFNFAIGTMLPRRRRGKGALLTLGVAVNLAALVYFKYTGLFFETLNAMGGSYNVPHIVLPLAISFFTFQQIAYLVDAARGETKEYNFRHYCLFVTFFPQLIAGPIVHHRELLPQFLKNKEIDPRMIAMGLTVFVIGLFKKVAIADNMGGIADPVFTAASLGTHLTFFEAWTGVLAYTMQIYFDFSGYSDMAVGLAALFGIHLELNFFSPYKSASIVEFWRRWHITLSRFLKDYLYIPLGGNRRGGLRRYFNLMATMLLGGLWHGASWTFAIWGGLHGIFLVLNHAWQKLSPRRLPKPAAVGLTFISVALAWVFFRAGSFEAAMHMLDCLTGKNGLALQHPGGLLGQSLELIGFNVSGTTSSLLRLNEKWFILWVALASSFFAPSTHELMQKKLALDVTKVAVKLKQGRFVWKPELPWAAAIGFMAGLSLLLLNKVNAFIYFQF